MFTSRPTVVLVRSRSRARLRELWAVLDAAGIPAQIDERSHVGRLVVAAEHLEPAVEELDDYRRELEGTRRPAPVELPGGWPGVLGYVAVLVTVDALQRQGIFDADWIGAGRAHASALLGEEPWRAVTALTLHLDAQHLAGNLLFGTFFGFLVSQGLGGGIAWVTIVLGGVLGNVVAAALHEGSHSAIGASTAVFAALGILVALALRHHRQRGVRGSRLWSPLVAGVLLLAWTGFGGERTDVLAHVTGWSSGVILGLGASWLPAAWLRQRGVQVFAAATAVALPVLAWLRAFGWG